MMHALTTARPHRRLASFDEVVARQADARISFTEAEALRASHWAMGEDARLREDPRFRPTPWGRWMISNTLLGNDALYASFVRELYSEVDLAKALDELAEVARRPCVFCPADDRFVLDRGTLRLSAKELTGRPLLEDDVIELEKYRTHLPVHSLKAAAASEPAGEWGRRAQEEVIETLGWVRVKLPSGRQLNDQMFVAQVVGHSMDDGRSGLVDGGFAVFELWPKGTKQNLRVLARGSFTDPETGSYAVKKYVGDTRDEEGRHQRITLVSLNPDKERYPDIELEVDDDDDLVVVAKVIPDQPAIEIARKPKPQRRPGRRNLTDADEQTARAERMRAVAERFFDGLPAEGEAQAEGDVDWLARLVCLDAESGGLCIESRPIAWLPSFAKKLAVATDGGQPVVVLASNLKHRTWRTPVAPATGQYRWSAPGCEYMLTDEDLASLTVGGLSGVQVELFRVDAAGVGQPMTGRILSGGGAYRLLVPPAMRVADQPGGSLAQLHGGWQLWELVVPPSPGLELRELLASLGVEIGKAAPLVRWVLRSPDTYGETPRGEAYPVFSSARSGLVCVEGLRSARLGEVMLIVTGQDEFAPLPLGAGSSWTVEIGGLAPGRYMLQVLHERTRFAPVTLPFAISDEGSAPVVARILASNADGPVTPSPGGDLLLECDLSLPEARQAIGIQTPALWPLDAWWDDGSRRRLGRISGGADGTCDLAAIEGSLGELLRRCSLGSLVLDGSELGRLQVIHSRRRRSQDIKTGLHGLIDERADTARNLDGQFPLLCTMWLHPVIELLGYGWQDPDVEEVSTAPPGTTAKRLVTSYRDDGGRIRQSTAQALVLVTSACDLDATDMFSARKFADRLCQGWNVQEAILTDGMRWARHRRHSHLRLKVLHIDAAVRAGDLFSFHDFLREFANPGAVEE